MYHIQLICFLIAFCLFNGLYAQISESNNKYFEKQYAWNGNVNNNGYGVLQKENGNFVIGGTTQHISGIWTGFYLELDRYGNIVQVIDYPTDSLHITIRDFAQTEDGYAMVGFEHKLPPDDQWRTYFLKIDNEGELMYVSAVGDSTFNNLAYAFTTTSLDNGYLLAGRTRPSDTVGYEYPYLIKLDAEGNALWDSIYFDMPLPFSHFDDIIETAPNEYWLIATVGFWLDGGDVMLLKMDGEGNILWSYPFNFGVQEQAMHFIPTLDNSFLITSIRRLGISTFTHGTVMKVNPDYMTYAEWIGDYFHRCGGGAIVQLPDSSFVVTGCEYVDEDGWNHLNAKILKLDKDGQILWERLYGGHGDYNEYGFDLTTTDDGGFIICGRTNSSFPITYADLYVVKTNCMGLLTVPKAAFTHTTTDYTAHFSNTSQYVYPDSTDGGHFLWDFGDGTTTTEQAPTHVYPADTVGVYKVALMGVVCSDTSIYRQSVCMGFSPVFSVGFINELSEAYTINFTNQSKYFYPDSMMLIPLEGVSYLWDFGDGATSTDTDPVHTYEQPGIYAVQLTAWACADSLTFTRYIEVSEPIGIQAVDKALPISLFYPNPTTQAAQMDYDLPTSQAAILQVFDHTGRLLKKVDLKGKGSYQLDLIDWAAGVYFYEVRLTSVVHDFIRGLEGQAVLREKLVVW